MEGVGSISEGIGRPESTGTMNPRAWEVNTGAISGVVRDPEGHPARGIRVELHDRNQGNLLSTVFTNATGGFEFHELPRGGYEVVASSGAGEDQQFVNVLSGEYNLSLRLPGMTADGSGDDTVSLANLKVPDKAKNELEKARRFLNKQKMDAARDAALKAIAIYPDYAEAHNFLGLLDLREHKVQDALAEIQKATQLDTHSPMAFYGLGVTYDVLGRYDDALHALDSSLRLSPNLWQTHYELGRAYLGKHDFNAALREGDKVLALAPAEYFPAHLVRAQALLGLQQYPQAIAELETYLKHEPQGPSAAEARETLDRVKALTANKN
jgi:tetratricopeptide (TPR) repeat protein